ncbi:MAG: hypothetical protein M3340_10350, partial [Actinomycetota bacterium]|nr:hypothetical protein [Actinomycetota bacterium]
LVSTPGEGPATGPGTDPGTGPGTDPGTGPGTGPGTDPGTDTVIPVLQSASVTNTTFAVNTKGQAETPVKQRVAAAATKRGTTFRYTLSERSRVVITVERKAVGRRVGKKCQKPSSKNRSRKRCTRWVRAGRFAALGVAGKNKKRFSGRIGKKSLAPGSYRAVLVATDPAGNVSKPRVASFKVVRR